MVGQTGNSLGKAGASLFGRTGSGQSAGSFGQTGVSSLFGQTAHANTSLFGKTAQKKTVCVWSDSTAYIWTEYITARYLFGDPVQPTPETPRKSLFGSADPSMDRTSMVGTNKAVGNEATLLRSSRNALPTIGSVSTVLSGASPQSSDNALNSVYTSFDQLTTVEREQFEAQTFTVGLIPTRPPPKELCM
ncbi:nucleoporin NUP42-like [Dreissena polymorpha]|uniref:nucleoporin NUP42-like n=1 Tax=Dreissena polymorpha TaxID=45954 RepID=UPI002263BE6A|nr:nucleoporin NUP42-like [Dreissena polymorpha]